MDTFWVWFVVCTRDWSLQDLRIHCLFFVIVKCSLACSHIHINQIKSNHFFSLFSKQGAVIVKCAAHTLAMPTSTIIRHIAFNRTRSFNLVNWSFASFHCVFIRFIRVKLDGFSIEPPLGFEIDPSNTCKSTSNNAVLSSRLRPKNSKSNMFRNISKLIVVFHQEISIINFGFTGDKLSLFKYFLTAKNCKKWSLCWVRLIVWKLVAS